MSDCLPLHRPPNDLTKKDSQIPKQSPTVSLMAISLSGYLRYPPCTYHGLKLPPYTVYTMFKDSVPKNKPIKYNSA